jgi:molecular chaperone GrpE (heat shock protein)
MSKKNIYQKLHSACIEAGGVKKADKVAGMKFNPLLHDAVQEVLKQELKMRMVMKPNLLNKILWRNLQSLHTWMNL